MPQGQQRPVVFSLPETMHQDVAVAVNTVQYLPSKRQSQLVELIGKRCIVRCNMDSHPVKVLWDTGAQFCIINESWRQQHLPHTVIRPIAELLEEDTLTVLAANDTPIPYVDWIEVSFQLDNDKIGLQVPILVSSDPAVASDAIIGYSVIEAVINKKEAKTRGEQRQLAHQVSKAFSITVKTAQNVVKLVQRGLDPDTGVVRTGGKRIVLPANQVSTIYVRAHLNTRAQGLDMMFTPDMLHPPPEGVSLSEVLVCIPDKKVKYIPVPMYYQHDRSHYLPESTQSDWTFRDSKNSLFCRLSAKGEPKGDTEQNTARGRQS